MKAYYHCNLGGRNAIGDIHQMINYHYNDFSSSAALGAAFKSQLKAEHRCLLQRRRAMVYSNSTPKPPPNLFQWQYGLCFGDYQFGQQYIFDPGNCLWISRSKQFQWYCNSRRLRGGELLLNRGVIRQTGHGRVCPSNTSHS